MFKQEKLYVCGDVDDREAFCKRLTDNGATIVTQPGEDCTHIFNLFQGDVFETCTTRGFRVLGVPCIRDCLENGKALPRVSHPVYSCIMGGISVYNEVVDEAGILKNYVLLMNGTWTYTLENAQYFITKEPSRLSSYALDYGSNVVRPSWIKDSWDNGVLANPKFHIFPPFSGCTISVTGLSTATRTTIQNLVLHYGGKYMPQLSRKVTHLLCDKPTGRKYTTALAWGVHIVTTNWLYDCINAMGTIDPSHSKYWPAYDRTSMGAEGGGGDAWYIRSPYSRPASSSGTSSGPSSYSSLSLGGAAGRSRLGYVAPILLRRNRNPAISNNSLLQLSSSHPHQFAQTTQIQSGPASHSALRQSVLQTAKYTTSRSREKDSRTSMDRYREIYDQVSGLLNVCDGIIAASTVNSFEEGLPPDISELFSKIDNLLKGDNNNNNGDIILNNTTKSTTIKNNNTDNDSTNPTNNKPTTSTNTPTTNKNSLTSPSVSMPPPETNTKNNVTSTEEHATDVDMDSEDESGVTTPAPSSEQEK